ncbi:MAG: ADP-ribosylglycohydrolase family protein, partial [Lachnospiraceae bacterium]|nr:ADP-ribosylglycohydrolase family protein [Lachnospiraceae bacterium]
DDSIMSLAIADALMQVEPDYRERMLYYGRKYPNPVGGYGGSFARWLASSDPQPYNSWGNGSAMRVSAIGWVFNTLTSVQVEAAASAEVTHNHTEGIRGAVAVATAVYMARCGHSKQDIMRQMRSLGYHYDNFTIVGIKQAYGFNETCMETVPAALRCFHESIDYVDCIRMAVSLGGDADTLACIAGAVAEAYYGAESIPSFLVEQALATLPPDLLAVYLEFKKRFCCGQ